jgi:hypothetical protein
MSPLTNRQALLALYVECKQRDSIDQYAETFVKLIGLLEGFDDNFQILKAFGYLRSHDIVAYQDFVEERLKAHNSKNGVVSIGESTWGSNVAYGDGY